MEEKFLDIVNMYDNIVSLICSQDGDVGSAGSGMDLLTQRTLKQR